MNTTTPRIRVGMVGLGMIFDETYRPVFEQLAAEGLFRRDTGLVEVELAAVATRTGKRAGGRRSFTGPDAVEQLVREVTARRDELDELIAQVSRTWRVERMARVDRNILRMATFELKHLPEIPARVALNEAIELAKRFGTAEAPVFINGLLDSVVKALNLTT